MINLKPISDQLEWQCSECSAATAKGIDTYIEQIEQLNQTLSAAMQEWDGVIKEQQAEIEQMMVQLSNLSLPVDSVKVLLDLLQPDIEMKEKIILNDERLINLINAYRNIRPK